MNATETFTVPHSPEAEQSVLGGLLIDNNSIDRLGDLPESAFFSEQHRLIYRAITRQSAAGQQWDAITVGEMLEKHGKLDAVGGLQYIGNLAKSVPSAANVRRYAEIVREHAARRQIVEAAGELAEMASGATPIQEALNRVQARLLALTETDRRDDPVSIGEVVSNHLNTIDQRLEKTRKGITTGFHDLDRMLNGGWHRGQVIVLAARPSMGKTALAMHHALAAAKAEYGVLFLSLEMTGSELSDRALASYGRIPLGNILTGELSTDNWDSLSSATSRLQSLSLHILDRSGLNFFQIAATARRHKRKHGLDVMVVDYLQLMAGTDPRAARHAQIEEITRNLKTLAKELDIAILLLSQLSRKTEESRRPKLSHLRDSGSIEQDADVVLFVHREEVDSPETQWKGYADVHVAKNRQGALGRIGVTYIGEQVRFESYAGTLPDWEHQINSKRKMFAE